ncbi:MAG: class I SAM-dependent methyltransferase [Archaeoglobaceae archaeon]
MYELDIELPEWLREVLEKLESYRGYNINYEPSEDEYGQDSSEKLSGLLYIPHEGNYKEMVSRLSEDDVLCDMGAGDLRFALIASTVCKKVYAVEMSPKLISKSLALMDYELPDNVIVICADWRQILVPEDVTIISCLVNISEEELPEEWKDNGRRVFRGIKDPHRGDFLSEL